MAEAFREPKPALKSAYQMANSIRRKHSSFPLMIYSDRKTAENLVSLLDAFEASVKHTNELENCRTILESIPPGTYVDGVWKDMLDSYLRLSNHKLYIEICDWLGIERNDNVLIDACYKLLSLEFIGSSDSLSREEYDLLQKGKASLEVQDKLLINVWMILMSTYPNERVENVLDALLLGMPKMHITETSKNSPFYNDIKWGKGSDITFEDRPLLFERVREAFGMEDSETSSLHEVF